MAKLKRNKRWERKELLESVNKVLDIVEKISDSHARVLLPSTEIDEEVYLLQISQLLLSLQSNAVSYNVLQHRITLIALQLIPQVRSEEILIKIKEGKYSVAAYVLANICLTNLGLPDTGSDEMVNHFLERDVEMNEQSNALRELQFLWLKSQWGNRAFDGSQIEMAIGNTVLNKTIDFTKVSPQDIHAFAEAMIYAAPFVKKHWLFPGGKIALANKAELLIAVCFNTEAYSQLAALVSAWAVIGLPWNPVSSFAFNFLMMLHQHGIVNESFLNKEQLPFILHLGLLCSTCLKHALTPYKKLHVVPFKKGAASKFFSLFSSAETGFTWLNYFASLEEQEQDALAGLLINILLLLNMKQQRFQTVSQLLNLGHVMGIPDNSIAVRAAEMLHEQGSFY